MNLQIICAVCDKPVVIESRTYIPEERSILYQVRCHGKTDTVKLTNSEVSDFPADFTMTKKAFINEL